MSLEELSQKIERLRQIASSLGEIVGRVSLAEVISVGADKHRVVVDMSFNAYLRHRVKIGEYLGVVTLQDSIMLGRVAEIRRRHAAQIAGIEPFYDMPEDLRGLETPAQIALEPITECLIDDMLNNRCDPTPVHTPVDPLSVVFRPSPTVIAKMLGLPQDGALLGMLYVGGAELPVEVRLPKKALYHHVLVVGTTGAGKTVLLKNMALSVLHEVNDALVVALDTRGDYLDMTLPPDAPSNFVTKYQPLDEITVIMPMTRDFIDKHRVEIFSKASRILGKKDTPLEVVREEERAEAVGRALAELYIEKTYPGAEVLGSKAKVVDKTQISEVEVIVEAGRVFSVRLLPWALKFGEVYKEVPYFFPFFSDKVSRLFPRLIETLTKSNERSVDVVIKKIEEFVATSSKRRGRYIKQHEEEGPVFLSRLQPSQVGNFERGMYMLYDTGLFDVSYSTGEATSENRRLSATFGEPDYRQLSGLVVVDLRFVSSTAASAVVYRVLSRTFKVREEEFESGVVRRPTFIFIDEAHFYFPQGRSWEDFNKDVVEKVIDRLTRLGRREGVGVVFATHSPADLNDLVIQLTNTKIAMRSEPKVLERIGMEEFAEVLSYAQSGVAVAKSFVYRTHSVTFKTLPPLTKHKETR